MVSPFFFPVTAETFNFVRLLLNFTIFSVLIRLQACVIFGSITIFGILSWYFTPAEKWLRREQILQALHTASAPQSGHGQLD